MMCETNSQIARLCYEVVRVYQVDQDEIPEWEKVALILGTVAVETGFVRNVSQQKTGLGLWNVSLNRAFDVFNEDLNYRHWLFFRTGATHPWRLFVSTWLGITSPKFFIPTKREMRYLLVNDDRFSCTLATWLYLANLDNLGENLTEVAQCWYNHFPSNHKNKKPVDFLDAWSFRNCDELMMGLGYR